MASFTSLLGLDKNPTSTITRTRKSIFDDGYIPTSKAVEYDDDYREKTYLQISSAAFNSLAKLGYSAAEMQMLRNDDFWELIVSDYDESHTENAAVLNTLSESFCWFATGPAPVQVHLTAKVMMSDEKDYRTRFLYHYASSMRAKQLAVDSRTLTLVVKDTAMKLFVLSINFTETSKEPDFSTFTLSGIGYKYRNIYAEEQKLYTGYYGKTAGLTTTAGTYTTKKEQSQQTQTQAQQASDDIFGYNPQAPTVVNKK